LLSAKKRMATASDSEELRRVMRRVYTHYANRVGTSEDPGDPYVSLSANEKTLLSEVDWLQVLGLPKIVFKVQADAVLNYEPPDDPSDEPSDDPSDEPVIGFVVSRSRAGLRLRIPLLLGPLRLIGVLWKTPEGATVATGVPTAINKQVLRSVQNLAAHLQSNETRSTLILYARQSSGVAPFPVENFKGVGSLHLVMQLTELRQWLWPDWKCTGPDCAAAFPTLLPTWPEAPSSGLAQWMQSHPVASLLWAGKTTNDAPKEFKGPEGPLLSAFQSIRFEKELADLVRVYDDRVVDLPDREAEVLKRATQIELDRRETHDLIDWWRTELLKPLSPQDRYHALLRCAEQVRHSFVDLDWELDAAGRDFLRDVELQLNDPQFMPHWPDAQLNEVEDGELSNSLHRALHMVNAQREAQNEEPLKLRAPIPHDVLKTWVGLQRTYGPADGFAPHEEYGLRMDSTQRALRQLLWRDFDQLEEMAKRCAKYPQARHECERLGLAVGALQQFRASTDKVRAKQVLLDQVRQSPQLRPLLDDILVAIA
jgi:hypothetical protein